MNDWTKFTFQDPTTSWMRNYNKLAATDPTAALRYLVLNSRSNMTAHNMWRDAVDKWAGQPISGNVWNSFDSGAYSDAAAAVNGTTFTTGGNSYDLAEEDPFMRAWQTWGTGYNVNQMSPQQLQYIYNAANDPNDPNRDYMQNLLKDYNGWAGDLANISTYGRPEMQGYDPSTSANPITTAGQPGAYTPGYNWYGDPNQTSSPINPAGGTKVAVDPASPVNSTPDMWWKRQATTAGTGNNPGWNINNPAPGLNPINSVLQYYNPNANKLPGQTT